MYQLSRILIDKYGLHIASNEMQVKKPGRWYCTIWWCRGHQNRTLANNILARNVYVNTNRIWQQQWFWWRMCISKATLSTRSTLLST